MSSSRLGALLLNSVLAIGIAIGIVTVVEGCASTSDTRLGSEPGSPLTEADPASYGADAMTFSKNQKRREPNDFMFYFKHCALGDERDYYSRTSYWCTDP